MLSTIPPRPVSVNSLARAPSLPSPISYHQKSGRSTSAEIQIHDESAAPTSAPVPSGEEDGDDGCCQSPVDIEMNDVQQQQGVGVESEEEEESCFYRSSEACFENLPIEIHEAILDCLFGERAPASATVVHRKSAARSWMRALRHPRRKALSNLALVSQVWRPLVQARIYRHIKVKGTVNGLVECARWFDRHAHLASHVRHIEIWVPVWGNRVPKHTSHPPMRRYNHHHHNHHHHNHHNNHHLPNSNNRNRNEDAGLEDVAALLQATMAWDNDSDSYPASHCNFYGASQNASLEDIFLHVQTYFPEARMLTLEGGHCKKPPLIRHFNNDPYGWSTAQALAVLPNIQTFVMRGAWNIMRDYQHWRNMAEALPSIREWDCAYAKPKIEAYETIAGVLIQLPPTLAHANISLDGFYNKGHPHYLLPGDELNPPHLCQLLGEIAPRLESLTFTGKVCHCFFDGMAKSQNHAPVSRLKSLDLVVKSCCRDRRLEPALPFFDEVSGITNMTFVRSFEKLIASAIQSLGAHSSLEYVRIRFIDLDSACPLLNPYFQLTNNQCMGLWSDRILGVLEESRPRAHYVELNDGIFPQYGPNHQIVGAVYPRSRPTSIYANNYRIIADATKF